MLTDKDAAQIYLSRNQAPPAAVLAIIFNGSISEGVWKWKYTELCIMHFLCIIADKFGICISELKDLGITTYTIVIQIHRPCLNTRSSSTFSNLQ